MLSSNLFMPSCAISIAVSSPTYRPGRIAEPTFLAVEDQVPSVARLSRTIELAEYTSTPDFLAVLRLIKEREFIEYSAYFYLGNEFGRFRTYRSFHK
jgi:hypothetical protein